ncbi:MAG: DUF86 domain-containing protein [Acetatifactor sp.]|nr:DUF86 domain-containing protein [Acetatifactor sp.]
MQHRDKIILQKIISEIEIGTEIIGELSLEEFLSDEKVKRAVGMTVINIGELIKNVTEEMRQSHKDVPWKEAAGMRDLTAHKYQTLRMEDVYSTVKIDFMSLKEQLQNILEEES